MATTTSAPRQRLSLTAEAAAQLQAQQTDDDQRVRVPPGSIEVGGAGVLGGLAGLPLAFVLDLALSDDHVCACSCSCSCTSPSLPRLTSVWCVRTMSVKRAMSRAPSHVSVAPVEPREPPCSRVVRPRRSLAAVEAQRVHKSLVQPRASPSHTHVKAPTLPNRRCKRRASIASPSPSRTLPRPSRSPWHRVCNACHINDGDGHNPDSDEGSTATSMRRRRLRRR